MGVSGTVEDLWKIRVFGMDLHIFGYANMGFYIKT